jgi:hypothetical protein
MNDRPFRLKVIVGAILVLLFIVICANLPEFLRSIT